MSVKIRNSKNWFKERISRFRPIVFLKKHIPFVIFFLVFLLSLLIGVWEINRFKIYQTNGEEVEEKIERLVTEYLEKEVGGKNFFSTYSKDVEDSLVKNISFVKSASIAKIAPNKLEVYLEIYQPRSLILDIDNKCKTLSLTGIVLEELCEEIEDVALCCEGYTSDGKYYIFKSDEAETSKLENGKEQLLVMIDIANIVKVVDSFGFKIKEITLKDKVVAIEDLDGNTHLFTLVDNINTQLARYYVIMKKVNSDEIQFNTVDVRFERPIVKN